MLVFIIRLIYFTFPPVVIPHIGWFSSLSNVEVDTKDLEDEEDKDTTSWLITSTTPTKNADTISVGS